MIFNVLFTNINIYRRKYYVSQNNLFKCTPKYKLNIYNRGGQEQNLRVCRNLNMPGVLVETGFITNKQEAIRCSDPASQQKVAEAIAETIAANI